MPLSRLAITEATSMNSTDCCGAMIVAGAAGAPGAGAAAGAVIATAAAAAVFGITLSVSRRISLTLVTIESHSLFSDDTSTCAVAPVLVPVVVDAPLAEFDEANCVEASELIFTLRTALR